MNPMRGTSRKLSPTVTASPSSVNHVPQAVRSVSLYHSERLKNMPKKNSAIIITGTTFRPEK